MPTPEMEPLVDGMAWSGFDRAVRHVPGGAAAVFRAIDVPLAVIDRPGQRTPFRKYVAYFEVAARLTGDPDFGFRFGSLTRAPRSGIPGYLVLNARRFRDAIRDLAPANGDARLLVETARGLALWMSYEDTIRVADLKTRRTRFERVAQEVRLHDDQLLSIHEFLHPRVEEIADTLPAAWGRWLLRTGWARRWIERFTTSGRVVRTSSLRGYLLLYGVANLRRIRRGSLRYGAEQARISGWLARIRELAVSDPELALATAECQRLVKGYGDTHVRGVRNFESVMSALPGLIGRPDGAARLRRLRDAALADEPGQRLAQELFQQARAA